MTSPVVVCPTSLDATPSKPEGAACRWATTHARELASGADEALEDRIAALMDRERAPVARRPILKRRWPDMTKVAW